VQLFKRFCDPPFENLPLLFDKQLEDTFASYRRFRHIVHHGYGFQLKWEIMKPGIEQLENIFKPFSTKVMKYLDTEFQRKRQ